MMNSPLAYIGGKSKLSKQIISYIPEHKTYCEVFSGAAWVFFRKPPSKTEVINDLDSDLITFYRIVQNHPEEFLRQFRWTLSSRELFEDWKDQMDGRGLTDIQRAARYYYLQRQAFGGRVRNRSYGITVEGPPRINLVRIEEDFIEMATFLKGIQGKFMLSINDHPDIREVFKDFNRKSVSLLYTVSQAGPVEADELIFSNFELKETEDLSLFSGV